MKAQVTGSRWAGDGRPCAQGDASVHKWQRCPARVRRESEHAFPLRHRGYRPDAAAVLTSAPAARRASDAAALLSYGARDGDDPPAGRSWFDAAYREAERTGDVPAMAQAVLGLCGLWVHEHRTAAAAGDGGPAAARAVTGRPGQRPGPAARARLAARPTTGPGTHDILAVLDQARGADPVGRRRSASPTTVCSVLSTDCAGRWPTSWSARGPGRAVATTC